MIQAEFPATYSRSAAAEAIATAVGAPFLRHPDPKWWKFVGGGMNKKMAEKYGRKKYPQDLDKLPGN